MLCEREVEQVASIDRHGAQGAHTLLMPLIHIGKDYITANTVKRIRRKGINMNSLVETTTRMKTSGTYFAHLHLGSIATSRVLSHRTIINTIRDVKLMIDVSRFPCEIAFSTKKKNFSRVVCGGGFCVC